MTFEIRTAERHGARLLIQLSGVSGSGKTYTALQLAYGLAGGDASKIIGIDTENRRMSLNAAILPGGARFRVLEFFAPFSPERYIQAIDAACRAGAEVIVIDSVTHEWEGPGGCQEIAGATAFPNWKKAKAEHKRFMTHMLQSPAHIIACTRAREKTDFTDTKNPKPLGLQPIQEHNFSFEATVSLMMHDQGRRQDVLKCPADLQQILGRGEGFIGHQEGLQLRAWVDGGVAIDPEAEQARGMLQNVAERGVEAFKAEWNKLTPALRKKLGAAFRDQTLASAEAYDSARQPAQDEPQSETLSALNQMAASVPQDLGTTTRGRGGDAVSAPPPAPAPAPAPAQAPSDDDGEVF